MYRIMYVVKTGTFQQDGNTLWMEKGDLEEKIKEMNQDPYTYISKIEQIIDVSNEFIR